jgi:hypothetical protein
MITLANTDKIEIALIETVTTNQLDCTVSYRDIGTTTHERANNVIPTNNTTAINLTGSPESGKVRVVEYFSIYNKDTVPATVIISLNKNGVSVILHKVTLSVGEQIEWTEKGFNTTGGEGPRISVEMFRDGANIADTNCPVALQFFKNLPYMSIQRVDLSPFKYVRFNVMKGATAGAAANKMILRYSSGFTTTAANMLDIGIVEVSVATNVLNTALTTGWIELAAGAKADVFVGILTSGGDGALDPAYGNISAEFK